MKKVLHWYDNNVAGAGTYAMTLIQDDTAVRSQATYTADREYGMTNLIITCTLGNYITITRSDHQGEPIALAIPADTVADYNKSINLREILGGRGVIINKNETVSITVTTTGNSDCNILMELDDKIDKTNAHGVVAAGLAAAVAYTPVETGGNMVSALRPNGNYRLRGLYVTSTTLLNVALGRPKIGFIGVQGQGAQLLGHDYTTLTKEQVEIVSGTGAELNAEMQTWITCVAADAAAVQRLHFIYECD